MKKLLLTAGVAVLLGACSGGGESGPTAELESPELGAAIALESTAPSNTRDINIDADFDLASSRSINVNFDIAEAEGTDASVSICTDYTQGGTAFDVNYESCTVTAEMQNGEFSHVMNVTHEFDSVVAVVWFQNPGSQPMYKEFFVDDTARSKGSQPTLVWR